MSLSRAQSYWGRQYYLEDTAPRRRARPTYSQPQARPLTPAQAARARKMARWTWWALLALPVGFVAFWAVLFIVAAV
jgi:hypothetical protein